MTLFCCKRKHSTKPGHLVTSEVPPTDRFAFFWKTDCVKSGLIRVFSLGLQYFFIEVAFCSKTVIFWCTQWCSVTAITSLQAGLQLSVGTRSFLRMVVLFAIWNPVAKQIGESFVHSTCFKCCNSRRQFGECYIYIWNTNVECGKKLISSGMFAEWPMAAKWQTVLLN